MTLTPLKKEFKKALSTIEIDEILHSYPIFYAGVWGFARTNEKRQAIINGINSGKIKTYDDVIKAIH